MAATGLPEMIGNFRIVSKLGQGGMGTVFRAIHGTLERPVALKILPAEFANHPEYVMRFLREARTVAGLRHENIVQVYDAGEQNGQYFIAMELVDGCNLLKYCEDKKVISEEEILSLLQQATRGLSAAHAKNLVHRDVKPENLLLGSDHILRMVDFGLVMEGAGSTQLTSSGACLGTPMYMSPEQADGDVADARTDIYSLGATFFRIAVGRPPFESATVMNLLFKHKFETPPSPKSLRPDLSENVSNLLLNMMAKRREDRPQTATKLLEMIEWIKQGKAVPLPSRFVTSVPSSIAHEHANAHDESGGNSAGISSRGQAQNSADAPPRAGKIMAIAFVFVGIIIGLSVWLTPPQKIYSDSAPPDTHGAESQKVPPLEKQINFLALGDETVSAGNYSRALEIFREGLIVDPANATLKTRIEKIERKMQGVALMRSGETLEQKGDLDEALAKFNAALALNEPTAQEAQDRIKNKQAQTRNLTDSTRLEQREQCAKDASAEEKNRRYAQAADLYSKTASLSDGAMRTMFAEKAADCRRQDHLARAFESEKSGDLNTAKTFYEKALAVRQDELVQKSYDLLLKKIRETEAVDALEKAFAKAMKEGSVALQKNDLPTAKTQFSLAQGLKNDAPEPQDRLLEIKARELMAQGDATSKDHPALALKCYKDALKTWAPLDALIQPRIKVLASLPPPASEVLQAVGIQVRAEQHDKAQAMLVEALRVDPNNAELKRAKVALENMKACSAIYAEITTLSESALGCVKEARVLDDDQRSRDLRASFVAMKKDFTEQSGKSTPLFLSHEYETLKTNLDAAHKDAQQLCTELEGAETYYDNRAEKVAESVGSSLPLVGKLGLGSDPKKAAKYKKLAESFKKLAAQVKPLKD